MGDQSNPGSNAEAVTPATADFSEVARGLYVGGTGDVSVRMAGNNGNTVVFSAVPAGTVLPIMIRGVNTASTATLMVRLW